MKLNSISKILILFSLVIILSVTTGTQRIDLLAELHGDVECRFLGASVASAGDVNGDGYSDILVGAPRKSDGTCPDFRGEVYLFYGGDPFDIEPDITFSRGAIDLQFGISIAANADLNDDQYDDFVISDYRNIYIFLGGAELDTIPDFILPQEITNPVDNGFGRQLDISGDFNGDGINDLVTSAPYYTDPDLFSGKVYVFFGGPDFDDIPDWTVIADTDRVRLGKNLALGDINGDEYDDLVLSGRFNSFGESDSYFIFYGASEPDTVYDVLVEGWQFTDEYFAGNIITLDLNQDQYEDIIVDSRDSMFVYFGSVDFDQDYDGILYHVSVNNFTESLAVIGDINGDGIMDIGAGCSYYPYPAHWGVMEIFYGSENLNNLPDLIYAPFMRNHYAYAMAVAGDVNGDNISDFIQGEPHYLEFNGQYPRYSGRVQIFSGDSTLIIYNLGDVNQDQSIDILDIVLTVNFILGTLIPDDEQQNLADMNQDSEIDVIDVLLIVDIIIEEG